MARTTHEQRTAAVLSHYPHSYAEQLRIRSPGGPTGLFQLLVMSLLMSARISSSIALEAARALTAAGWTTAAKMADATWEQRTRTLNRSGYARYDERTSRMLGATAELLVERYRGDLRRLRADADEDPAAERRLLKECKGMGDVGVDIFFREVQGTWQELYPFADDRALRAARALGLPADPHRLAGLMDGRAQFVRLVSGLVQADLEHSIDELATTARQGS